MKYVENGKELAMYAYHKRTKLKNGSTQGQVPGDYLFTRNISETKGALYE